MSQALWVKMGVRIKQQYIALWFKVLDYVRLYEYFKALNSVLVQWQKHLFYHLLRANPVRARKKDKEGECVATVCVFPVQAAFLSFLTQETAFAVCLFL